MTITLIFAGFLALCLPFVMLINGGPSVRGGDISVMLGLSILWLGPLATAIYFFTLAADALPW